MEEFNVFIDGSSGTTGLKIHELLSKRKEINIINIHEDRRRQMDERLRCMEQADLSILCLPDEEAEAVCRRLPEGCRVIDTSTAHRTSPDWVYGLPELAEGQRERIASARRVSNPGCHATGFILLAAPLTAAGVIGRDCPLSAFSLTGYSGGGKKMIARYRQENRPQELDSPGIYGLEQTHKHLKEMTLYAGLDVPPAFLPAVCDYYSGMLVSIPLQRQLMKKMFSLQELRELYSACYRESIAVTVCEEQPEGTLYSSAMSGESGLQILVYGNEDRPVVSARFDNLGKGAAAAAVENMELMLGISK
ncbi:MAG: N-acetyl-gamma-glutamyl-phosphate reductase [Emergencia sp.]